MARPSVPWRTQPPAVEDPPEGRAPLDYMADERESTGSQVIGLGDWADGGEPPHLDENSISRDN